eukprot:s1060_g8.t1
MIPAALRPDTMPPRRTTDLFWLLLFLCAVAAQVFFALVALYHGVQIDFEGGSFDEVLQNVTVHNGWLSRAKERLAAGRWIQGQLKAIPKDVQLPFEKENKIRLLARFTKIRAVLHAEDAVTNWVELRPQNLRLESQGIAVALGTSAVSSGAFLLLLAYFPVHLVVNVVAVGGPLSLLAIGGLAISGSPVAQLLGVEAHFGWPLVLVGTLGRMDSRSKTKEIPGVLALILVSFAWGYLRLGIAVLRCSAAFLRARPSIGAYPLLFGLVHLAGLALWGLAVLGIRSSFQDVDDLDWQSQFGTASAMLLCFLWGNSFVTGLSTFAVAYAASHWYGRGPKDAGHGGLVAIQVGLRYHAGSLALGSLLLALVRTLNVMLWWAEKAQEEAVAAASGAAHRAVGLPVQRPAQPPSLLRSLRNFAAEVLEVIATWASKQAFVQIAMSGCPFATGAMRAGQLALKAPAGFVIVESLSMIFQRACEFLLIGVAVLVASSFGLEGLQGLGPVAVSAWLAAESLLHPYSVATTTILHCCLLDKDAPQEPWGRLQQKGKEGKVPPEAVQLQRTLEELSGYLAGNFHDEINALDIFPLRAGAEHMAARATERFTARVDHAEARRLTAKKQGKDQLESSKRGQDPPTKRPRFTFSDEPNSMPPPLPALTEAPSDAGEGAQNTTLAVATGPGSTEAPKKENWHHFYAAAKAAEAATMAGAEGITESYTVVEVPDEFTGLLIGKHGIAIKQMQDLGWEDQPRSTGKTLDLSKVYKQLPVLPAHSDLAVVHFKDEAKRPVFYVPNALMFGSTAAVYAFNRVSRSIWFLINKFMKVPLAVYFDDYPMFSPEATALETDGLVSDFLELLGWRQQGQTYRTSLSLSMKPDATGSGSAPGLLMGIPW